MPRTRWEAYLDGAFTIPATDALGFERVDEGDPRESVTFRWKVPASLCNSAGNLQGGVLAAFVDAALGGACAAHLPEDVYPALAEMKVSFLRPARGGTTIAAKARVLKPGKRLIFVEAEVTDEEGNLLARVTATEVPTPT